MNLPEAISHALSLTLAMKRALDGGDIVGAMDLLGERSLAMEQFQDCHRQAGTAEREQCANLLKQLKLQDEALQTEAGNQLRLAAQAFHESSVPKPGQADPAPCLTGCLDHRA